MSAYARWIVATLLAGALQSQAQTIEVNKGNRTIAVTASDSASGEADTAVVSIGFQAYGPEYQEVYSAGTATSNAIVKALLDTGVPRRNVESANQSLEEVTQFPPSATAEERAQRRYHLQQSWRVTVPSKNASAVLDLAVREGANSSGSIQWEMSDENALEGRAAELALERARAIARNMAKGLGTQLGALIYASNQVPNHFGPIAQNLESASPGKIKAMSSPRNPLVIIPETIKRSATVYAVFAIE